MYIMLLCQDFKGALGIVELKMIDHRSYSNLNIALRDYNLIPPQVTSIMVRMNTLFDSCSLKVGSLIEAWQI